MTDQTKEAWTPGPWEAFVNEFTPDFNVRAARRFVCSVTAQQEPMGSANAHLIAAAPDLYAALTELCDRLGPRWFLEQGWAAPIDALSKARGES